jgi:tetratricopeptide (TPR) repeat protein
LRTWKDIRLWLLMVTAIAALGPVVSNQFFSVDDPAFIEDNEIEYPLDSKSFLDIWSRSTLGLYIPVPNIAWSLISEFARSDTEDPAKLGYAEYPDQRYDPSVFHAVSLACHILTAILVYACLIRLGVSSWGAFFGTGVFLFHPVQVEGLAWASLLKDLMATAFCSAALLLYLTYVDSKAEGKAKGIARLSYFLATTSYLLALCSKPGAIMLPFIIGLIGLVSLRRPFQTVLREMIPWALLAIPIIIVTLNAQLEDAAAQFEMLDDYLRPLIALDALGFYLVKLAAPIELAFDYGRSPSQALGSFWIYVSWIPPVVLGALAYLGRRRCPWFVVAYGVFLLGLLPVLGLRTFAFQTFSTVTDHYLSLSMLGVAIGVGGGFDQWSSRDKPGVAALIIGFVVLGSLGMKSHLQLRHWQDSHTIVEQAIDVNPNSWFSYRMLGLEHQLANRPDEALAHFRKSMSINGNTFGHSGLFDSLNAAGDFERAYFVITDVVDRYHRGTDYFSRSQVNIRLGRAEDATRDLQQARELDPSPAMSARIATASRELEAIRADSSE